MTDTSSGKTEPHGGRYIVGIDTGGTFTDVTVLTPDGEVTINKSPTTPGDFSLGVMNAVEATAESLDITPQALLADAIMVKHGTTVSTNAMITRTGSKVGLIETKGFEDTPFIMRAIGRVDGLDEMSIRHVANVTKPEPFVPKSLVRGVYERIDYLGRVVVPLDESGLRESLAELVEGGGVEAIAVSLLFSWMNPAHEDRVAEIIAEMYPGRDLYVTLSHKLAPVMGEYARTNTVIVNAFLERTIVNYVNGLKTKLTGQGLRHDLMIMQSNGGIVRPEQMTAVGSLQSGPAGGMIATEYVAKLLDHANVITTDMGGTSFDVGLLTDHTLSYAREPIVERYRVLQPMIQVESIGAGGGTIARVDEVTGRLLVGPESAGADPGPIVYGMGGEQVTVTDANVVLGYIDPDYFLGGRRKLDKAAAEGAIKERIADPLGLSVIEAAAGIFDVVNSKMSDLIRKQVVREGHIPEEYAIYAFGGAGPVHAAAYGAELGIDKIYVFPTSPVFSSFGIASADVIHTTMITRHFTPPIDMAKLDELLTEIETGLGGEMAAEGFGADDISFRRTLYMRYARQMNEVGVPIPTRTLGVDDRTTIEGLFNKKYEDMFGSGASHEEAGIEIISIGVDAIGATPKPQLKQVKAAGEDARAASKGTRQAYFTGADAGWHDAGIYDYLKLAPGNVMAGPAIIETPFTTIVVPQGKRAEVDSYLNIVIEG